MGVTSLRSKTTRLCKQDTLHGCSISLKSKSSHPLSFIHVKFETPRNQMRYTS